MRDPEHPQLDPFIRRALRQIERAEKDVPKDLPRGRGLYAPPGLRSYLSETSDDYKAFITPADVGRPRTSESDTVQLAAALPCDWVIREGSRLNSALERVGGRDHDQQLDYVDQWAPQEVRNDIERLVRDEGGMFLHSEQLLAAMRLAIEHGSDKATSPLGERMRIFSWLLLSINDRLSDEGPPESANEEAYTAFGLRAMGYASSQVLWHVLARSEATWFTVRKLLRDSKKYVPVDAEFEQLTGVRLSAHMAAVTAAFAHTEEGLAAPGGATISPQAFFSKTPDPPGLKRALQQLAASRNWYRAAFAKRGTPRYAGIAMLPFRQRPLYELGDGGLISLSAHFLVDRGSSGVYWTIADGRQSDDKRRREFTDFVGEIHERYVYELARSTVDEKKNLEVVYSDVEAAPAKRGADTVIIGHDAGVFLETTSTALNYDRTVAPADLTSFDAEANEKIVKKIVQLEDAISEYRDGTVMYPTGSDARRYDRTIWPVIVLREPFPYMFLIERRIGRLLSATRLKRQHAADPPVRIMSVEEVELALRRGDPDRLRRLLAEWRMDDAYRSESFRNFYFHRHNADGPANSPYLLGAYDALFARAARELGFQLRMRDR